MGHVALKTPETNLAIAHRALKKAIMPKAKYEVEDYTDNGDTVEVDYCVLQGAEFFFDSATISKVQLIDFITDNYSDTVDTFFNGEHQQSEAGSPAVYLEENMSEVLTGYLNNVNNA